MEPWTCPALPGCREQRAAGTGVGGRQAGLRPLLAPITLPPRRCIHRSLPAPALTSGPEGFARGRGPGLEQGHGQVTNTLISGCKMPGSAQPEATGHRGLPMHLPPRPELPSPAPARHQPGLPSDGARPPGHGGFLQPLSRAELPTPRMQSCHRPGCRGTRLCDTGGDGWGALSACGSAPSPGFRDAHTQRCLRGTWEPSPHKAGWAGPPDPEPPSRRAPRPLLLA